jgi:hypothetical protein
LIGTRNKRCLPASISLYEKPAPKSGSGANVYGIMDLWNIPTLRALTGNLNLET